MTRFSFGLCLALFLLCYGEVSQAETTTVTTKGFCAIVGMTPEQATYLAKQRARSAAIEQAAGVRVTSSTLVTNGKLAASFIKTFSRGYIVKEDVRWLPLTQYQESPSTPPVAKYGVELTATVFIPEKQIATIGLEAELDRSLYRSGEKASLTVRTRKPARIAVFNLTADGKAIMVFPHEYEELRTPGNLAGVGLPSDESGMELVMVNLPDHKRDAEGFFVAALGNQSKEGWLDYFEPGRYMDLNDFFAKYTMASEMSEDMVLPYEIIAGAQ